MLEARRLIADRSGEKLTLDVIARSCGLNRSKLSKGFKTLFDCTVAQAIAEQRLESARRRLLTTDLPVSSIGYEAGYSNNASFARAFGRRFGRPPSGLRCGDIAA
jgi:AraC family transcriptional activator of pyochelin receptor